MLSDYQQEQLNALNITVDFLRSRTPQEIRRLRADCDAYVAWRADTAGFLGTHLGEICTRSCYENKVSACCSRDGIVVHFADMMINALVAGVDDAVDRLRSVLEQPHRGFKCVYLTGDGCRWRLKPVVCEMFLCDDALRQAQRQFPDVAAHWQDIREASRRFTWPDRDVLFDRMEQVVLDSGMTSSLMHLHFSPGLLRVKQRAGRSPA